jgi:CDP-glycerol glycerophosphotransferase (TagB/SpsB family)
LECTSGEYINFIEGSDVLFPDLIAKVDSSTREFESNIISMPIRYHPSNANHNMNYRFRNKNVEDVVDLKKYDTFVQIDVNNSFIRRDAIGNMKFNSKIKMAAALFINKILIEDNHYFIIKDTQYTIERRPKGAVESKEEILNSFEYFFNELIDNSISKYSAVPKFIQHTFLYYLQYIVQIEDIREFFTSEDELNQFWDNFVIILSHIGVNEIHRNKLIKDSTRNFLKFIKNDDFHIECKGKEVLVKSNNDVLNTLHKRKLWFDIVEIKDGFLNISGSFQSSCDKRYISVEAIKSGNNIKTIYEATGVEYPNTHRETKYYLSIPWEFTYSFDLKIPIEEGESFSLYFRTIYQEGSDRAVMDSEVTCRYYVNLSAVGNYFRKDNKILLLKKNVIYVRPESYLRAAVYEFKVLTKLFFAHYRFKTILKTSFFRLACFIAYPFYKNRKIWLFSDRRDLSGDNGEHFFRYAMTRKDDVHKYFILKDDCEDYGRLKKIYGKHVVAFGSFKHKFLYAFAKRLMQSQISPSTYNPLHEKRRRRFAGLGLGEVCFLQHGVNRYDMSSWVTKFDKNLSLILTVSDLDYKEFTSDHYAYDNSIVQILGYPRFDNLTNENLKRQIVIMPTWRNYIKNANQLLNSEYYERFNGLLNNERLIEHAKKTGYEIILKPHPLMYKFINVFDVNEYVKVDNVTKHHDILCDCALMITDYSSVVNDFAYLKKPVIYYQYGGGKDHHFDITTTFVSDESMDFGEIIEDEERLIDKIIEYMDNDCKMEEIYRKRVDNFFKFTDKNNSKRVYDWIYSH